MSAIIEEIVRLSGALPDGQKHRRYLETLTNDQLEARAKALREDCRPGTPAVRFWRAVPTRPTERTRS